MMAPTTTEHDFRFPRRPEIGTTRDDGGGCGIRSPDQAWKASLHELHRDISKTYSEANNGLFGSAIFSFLETANAEEAAISRQDDPLAAQVWRFFRQSRRLLPNQDRMENLTWRMMALKMRKAREQQEEKSRYVYLMLAHGAHSISAVRSTWEVT